MIGVIPESAEHVYLRYLHTLVLTLEISLIEITLKETLLSIT